MRALIAGLALLALAGCGTDDDQQQARHATERFYAAVRAHDAAEACAALSEDVLRAIDPCSRSVTGLKLQGGPVVSARVFITNALVELQGGEYVFLGREPGGWKVDAAGCRFAQGKPQSRPADCEVQG